MNSWDAVVDVSNVCWSPLLPPVGRRTPFWHRLELVLFAWRELHGSGTRFTLVADESLVRELDEVVGYRRLRDKGEIMTRPVADSLILELARDYDFHVITRDHYVDHRAQHPWIEASPTKFHCWNMIDGRVRIEPLNVVPRSAQTVSEAIEVKYLGRTKLNSRNPQHRKILGTRWKCVNTICVEATQRHDQLLVWPIVNSRGTALCPSCSFPLRAMGPHDLLYEAVVEDRSSHEEIMRFPLEVNRTVTVGRGSSIECIDLAMHQASFGSSISKVSRQHLRMRIEDVTGRNRRMIVIDLESSNGTAVERWTGAEFQKPKRLSPNRDAILGSKDRLILGGTICVRLSGKHYVTYPGKSEPAALAVLNWMDAEDSPTVLG